MISRTNVDLREMKEKAKTPLFHPDNKITCGICGNKFSEEEMTGKTRGIWFVICCEGCRKEEQEIGKVVWEPENKGR